MGIRIVKLAIFGSNILLGNLLMVLLLTITGQSSYADDGIIVSASRENNVISFNVSNADDSPAIYGFIVTTYSEKHYSKIADTPLGWTAGTIKYRAIMWMTENYPIRGGTTEDRFAMEVKQQGQYIVGWSVIDEKSQPIAWGTIIIDE